MYDPKVTVGGVTLDNNPDRPIEEILVEIKRNSLASISGGTLIGAILPSFSALLVHLSRDAERIATAVNKKTQALISLTWILIFMTGILILLTIPLVAIETIKFITETSKVHQHSTQYKKHHWQNDQQTETTEKPDNRLPPFPFINVIFADIGVSPTLTVPCEKN